MAEGQEVPDQEEDAGSQNSQPESPVGPSDAQREAKENLADKVDDNKVEAAGQKGGLKAALASRLDVWSENIREARRNYLARQEEMESRAFKAARAIVRPRSGVRADLGDLGTALYVNAKGIIPFTNPLVVGGVMLLAEKSTSLLRNRLQPKHQPTSVSSPEAPSSK